LEEDDIREVCDKYLDRPATSHLLQQMEAELNALPERPEGSLFAGTTRRIIVEADRSAVHLYERCEICGQVVRSEPHVNREAFVCAGALQEVEGD